MSWQNIPAIVKAIVTLGPVTVMAFLLLAVNVGWLPSPVVDNQTRLTQAITTLTQSIIENRARMDAIDTMNRQHSIEFLRFQDILGKGLRRICRNTSKSQFADEQCDAM